MTNEDDKGSDEKGNGSNESPDEILEQAREGEKQLMSPHIQIQADIWLKPCSHSLILSISTQKQVSVSSMRLVVGQVDIGL